MADILILRQRNGTKKKRNTEYGLWGEQLPNSDNRLTVNRRYSSSGCIRRGGRGAFAGHRVVGEQVPVSNRCNSLPGPASVTNVAVLVRRNTELLRSLGLAMGLCGSKTSPNRPLPCLTTTTSMAKSRLRGVSYRPVGRVDARSPVSFIGGC